MQSRNECERGCVWGSQCPYWAAVTAMKAAGTAFGSGLILSVPLYAEKSGWWLCFTLSCYLEHGSIVLGVALKAAFAVFVGAYVFLKWAQRRENR